MVNLFRKSTKKQGRWVLLALLINGFWVASASNEAGNLRESGYDKSIQQRTKKVIGTVRDVKGEPLPGVNIVVKGTTVGVISDFDGNFEINVPENQTDLVFSYIGFKELTLKVTEARSGVKVVLEEDTQQLEEVVVTALGIKRQEKALSYNVQQVKSEELTRVKDANFVNSLNGKVAGVNIQRSAAGVGGATKVVMRGLKSIDGNNGVLYVIDGVPMFNFQTRSGGGGVEAQRVTSDSTADINPEDIESINVLTGPSAAALYGSEAANGVILINTKKGKEGKTEVNISSGVDFMNAWILPEFQNTYGNALGDNRSWGARLATPSTFDPKKFFNTGVNINNSVTLSIGNQNNQTFVSVSQTDAEGLIPNNNYYRYNIGARNTSTFLKDKLHLDVSANYILQGERNMITGGGYRNPLVGLYLMPRSLDYRDIEVYERYDPTRGIYTRYQPYPEEPGVALSFSENPYWVANRQLSLGNKKRYMFSASLKYDVLDWLNVTGRVRVDNTTSTIEEKIYASSAMLLTNSSTKGLYSNENINYDQTYADIIANMNKNFGEDFVLTANLGASYNDRHSYGISIGGPLLTIPNLFSAQNLDPNKPGQGQSYNRTRNIALFASAELGYKGMLYLTATGRNDWSSQLVNSAEPSFFYPSVGLSGVISQMVKLPEFVNYLKVRGSYTEVGSPISKTGLTPGTITYKLTATGVESLRAYPYPDFKAERTASWEVGLNSKFFSNKLGIDLTLYKSNTYNQFFNIPLSRSSGFTEFYLQAGDVENRGIELGVNFNTDIVKNLHWDTSLTYSRNINEIKQLVRNYRNPFTGAYFDMTEIERGGNILKEGGSIADITTSGVLLRDANGDLIQNLSGGYVIDQTQRIKIGRATPDFTMGWRHSLSYKNFDVNVLFNGSFGGIVLSGTQAALDFMGVSKASADARDAGGVWVNGKQYPAQAYYETIGKNSLGGYYNYDATNVRLQEASISYNFDGKIISDQIKRITLSAIGTNLWMIYNKAPFDPQLVGGTGTYSAAEFFQVPSMRTYGMSVKLQF
ncbi:MAG: SusC/RagA family TonB-linked outer membrane protein [Capnocytophaga sp.]|nr:SusC/RagA family TonB-linked outer membrane protein [Capnocytophaga sp.]